MPASALFTHLTLPVTLCMLPRKGQEQLITPLCLLPGQSPPCACIRPAGMLEDIELSALASCGMSWQHSGGQSGTLGPLGAEAEAVGPTGTVGEGQGVPDCWATEEVGPSAAVVRGQAGTGSWQAEAVGTSEAGGAGQAAVGCWPPWGFGQLSPPLSQLQSSLSHSLPSIPSIPDLATGAE